MDDVLCSKSGKLCLLNSCSLRFSLTLVIIIPVPNAGPLRVSDASEDLTPIHFMDGVIHSFDYCLEFLDDMGGQLDQS